MYSACPRWAWLVGAMHAQAVQDTKQALKDGKIIRSDCTKLSMDSNENDLKERVGIAMLEDL
jgi:hypothetical protein